MVPFLKSLTVMTVCILGILPNTVRAGGEPAAWLVIDNHALSFVGHSLTHRDQAVGNHLQAQAGDLLSFRLEPKITDPSKPTILRVTVGTANATTLILASAQDGGHTQEQVFDIAISTPTPCHLAYVPTSLNLVGTPGGATTHPLLSRDDATLFKQLTGEDCFTLSGPKRAVFFFMEVTSS